MIEKKESVDIRDISGCEVLPEQNHKAHHPSIRKKHNDRES